MAANPIKSNEVIQDNLFKNTIESGIMLIQVSEQILSKFKEIAAETKGGIGGVKPNSYEGIKKLGEETQKVNTIYIEAQKIATELAKKKAQVALSVEHLANKLQEESVVLEENRRVNKENAKLHSDSIGAYDKLSITLNKSIKAYRDLAAAEMAGTVEAKKLLTEITHVDTKLKAIDASTGRYNRNVGNYASGFSGLSNSINQVTREFPAFVNSAQTGFMAISNNLPILIDQINQLKVKNAELNAEGKAGVPVWKQVVSGFFSWQTLMGVGITLMVTYGKELGNYLKQLFGVEVKTKEQIENEKKLSEARDRAIEDTAKQTYSITSLAAVIEDENNSSKIKIEAYKQLQKLIPELTALTYEQATSEGVLTEAITRQLKLIELRAEFEIYKEQIIADKKAEMTAQKIADESKIIELEKEKKELLRTELAAAKNSSIIFTLYDKVRIGDINEEIKFLKMSASQKAAIVQEQILDIERLATVKAKVAKDKKGKTDEQIALEALELQHKVNLAIIEMQKDSVGKSIALIEEGLAYENAVNEIKIKNYDAMLKLKIAATVKADNEIEKILRVSATKDEIGLIDGTKAREDAAKSQAAANKKRQSAEEKDKQNLLTKSLQGLQRQLDAENQIKMDAINKDIQANQKRQDLLRNMAAEGAQDAQNNLAFELRRQAELESKREKQIKKQIRQEQTLAILKAFASGDTRNVNAIKNLGIASFFEGTEDTGTVNSPLDANGGRLAVLHDNERVLTKEQNKKAGGLTNDEAANVLNAYNLGQLINPNQFDRMPMSSYVNDERQINALQEVKNEIRDLKQIVKNRPVQKTEFDEVEKLVRHIVVTEYKKEITSRKTGGLHGR